MLSAGNNPRAPHCRGTPNGDLGGFRFRGIRSFALEPHSSLEVARILSMHFCPRAMAYNVDGWLPIRFGERHLPSLND
jgi:hypothetical protein